MKALVKYGEQTGGYRYEDVDEPVCGLGDIIIEIKAASICGSDRRHYKVDNDSDGFNYIRGHEFSGEIVQVGKNVKDWLVGQRVVSDNTGYVCGVCPACEMGDYLVCPQKVNLGLGMDGGFTKFVKIPAEILAIHGHAIWEIPENISYEEAALLDPVCNAYKAIAQRSRLLPGDNVIVYGTGALGLCSIQIARIMGAEKIICVGQDKDIPMRFDIAKKLGATHVISNTSMEVESLVKEICGMDEISTVVDCVGAASIMQEGLKILRPNGEFIMIGHGFKPLNFDLSAITTKAISIIGHMGYDSRSWRNSIALLRARKIDTKSMITHRLPLSEWEKGFDMMATGEAIKVILYYDE